MLNNDSIIIKFDITGHNRLLGYLVTIVSTLRGVSSPAPLMACPVDMSPWIGRTDNSFTPTLKRGSAFFFFFFFCKMDVPSSGGLDMNESLHLIIDYLLRGEWKDLESKSYN